MIPNLPNPQVQKRKATTEEVHAEGAKELRRLRTEHLNLHPYDLAYREALDRGDIQPAGSGDEACEIGRNYTCCRIKAMQKTKTEIVDEAIARIERYGRANDNLAADNGVSFYLMPDTNRRCPIAACLRPEVTEVSFFQWGRKVTESLTETQCNVDSIIDFENLLMPEYRGHSINFWVGLRKLHGDFDLQYWWPYSVYPRPKITEKGRIYATSLKNFHD